METDIKERQALRLALYLFIRTTRKERCYFVNETPVRMPFAGRIGPGHASGPGLRESRPASAAGQCV
jgi:hypothetical protein